MLLRYRATTGHEVTVETEQELIMALRTRRITAETPVQLPGHRSWAAAGSLPAFEEWVEKALTFTPPASVAPVSAQPAAGSGPTPGQLAWLWLGVGMVLGSLVIIVGVYSLAQQPPDFRQMGYIYGQILGRGLVATAVLGPLIVLILRGPKVRHLWVFVPILGLVVFGQSLYQTVVLVQERLAEQPAQSQVQPVLEARVTGQPAGLTEETTPLGRLYQTHLRRVDAIREGLQANLDEHGLGAMLLPETLGDPAAIAAARESLLKWDARLVTLEQEAYQAYAETEKEIAALEPASLRQSTLEGFQTAYPRTRVLLEAFFQVEHELTRSALGLFTFLQEAHDRKDVEVSDGRLRLRTEGDEQEYQRLLDGIYGVVEREVQLQREMQREAELLLQRLRP